MGQLVASGHELTPQPSDADVIVVNTCSFIDLAKQESVDTILEMAEYKKSGKAQRLIVAGCLVERFRGDIQENLPEVDAVLGTNELEKITALCEGLTPKAIDTGTVSISRLNTASFHYPTPLGVHQNRRRLRSSLLVLHYSAIPWRIPKPPLRKRNQ